MKQIFTACLLCLPLLAFAAPTEKTLYIGPFHVPLTNHVYDPGGSIVIGAVLPTISNSFLGDDVEYGLQLRPGNRVCETPLN